MDFKGHVGARHGSRLHPLTVLDDHSRFAVALKACAAISARDGQAPPSEGRFRRYGLPGRSC